MDFNLISERDLKTIYPKNNMTDLQKLSKEQKEKYINLYSLYRKLFTEYIIEKLDLISYEDKIDSSNLGFIANDIKNMDLYQYFSSGTLKYFYIRNNVYIEVLNELEIEFLNQRLKNKNYNLDAEAKEFIEGTYSKVIFEDRLKNNKIYDILYGPDSSYFFAKNNSLVIGIFCDTNLNNESDEKKCIEIHDKREVFLNSLINKMSVNLRDKLNVPVSIKRYDHFSIISRM